MDYVPKSTGKIGMWRDNSLSRFPTMHNISFLG